MDHAITEHETRINGLTTQFNLSFRNYDRILNSHKLLKTRVALLATTIDLQGTVQARLLSKQISLESKLRDIEEVNVLSGTTADIERSQMETN